MQRLFEKRHGGRMNARQASGFEVMLARAAQELHEEGQTINPSTVLGTAQAPSFPGEGACMSSELREALLKALDSRDLPNFPIKNPHARLMAALWRMAADDFLGEHPTAWEEAQLEEQTPIGVIYTTILMEVHTWEKHGCRAVDFVFPVFFGAKVVQVDEDEE